MSIKRLLLIFLSIGLLIFGILFIKKSYLDPANGLVIAQRQVKQLVERDGLKNGDIIFQTSLSQQSLAIQSATHSKYSHCGLIFQRDSGQTKWFVLEAVQPVKWTPLDEWISRGEGGRYVIKRVSTDPWLPDEMLLELKNVGDKLIGKSYDIYFEWSDSKIYCSELVWKVYYEVTRLSIGELQLLKDFDLSNEYVKNILNERYGDMIPLNEKVISPASIFNSDYLITIADDQTPANNETIPAVGLSVE